MKAGIMGLDFFRFILRRWFSWMLAVPLVNPLTPTSLGPLPLVWGVSSSGSLCKPLWPFVTRCVVMVLALSSRFRKDQSRDKRVRYIQRTQRNRDLEVSYYDI